MSTVNASNGTKLALFVRDEARRLRELALAYRIAARRIRSSADVAHLAAYEHTAEQLARTLELAVGSSDAPLVRADVSWLKVGAQASDARVFDVMRGLEAKSGEKLAWLADLAPPSADIRSLLSRASCASQVRQAWLSARASTCANRPAAQSAHP